MAGSGDFGLAFLTEMARRNIRALVIGRQAMALYGAPVGTNDIDLHLSADEKELKRIESICDDFGLPEREELLSRHGFLFLRKVRLIVRFDEPLAGFPPRRVDIFPEDYLHGVSFQAAHSRSIPIELAPGLSVRIPAVEDMIRLKKAAGRSRDREDIRWLKDHRRNLEKR